MGVNFVINMNPKYHTNVRKKFPNTEEENRGLLKKTVTWHGVW